MAGNALILDTSALVKILVQEKHSDMVRTAAEGAGVILASHLGYTEASVSFARMMHAGQLTQEEMVKILGQLDDFWEQSIQDIPLSEEVLSTARSLAQRHVLRTYDAIHLATARQARRILSAHAFEGELLFAAFDRRLLLAAQECGFRLLTAPELLP